MTALREVRDAAHAASIDSTARLDAIADLHRKTYTALLHGFEQLNQSLEWGFSSLLWAIDQQTEVLRSIDQTLKTPGQTQADEWRLIGEGLRQRGGPEAATTFFLDALKLNPLDYRIYLGLAHAYFELSRFDDADQVLVSSLPHAPRKGFDYRSVTYRLMGRIRFCREQYHDAMEQLRQAVLIEPKNAKAFYDLAQYSSCTTLEHQCVTTLRYAIERDPTYWYAARVEPLFSPFRMQVDRTLQTILSAPLAQAENDFETAAKSIDELQPKADECKRLANDLKKRERATALVRHVSEALNIAQRPFDRTDYNAALGVAERAAAVRESASSTLHSIEEELKSLRDDVKQRKAVAEAAEKARRAAQEARRRTAYQIALGIGAYLFVGGMVGLMGEPTLAGFGQGILGAILIPIGIWIFVAWLDS
jgi:tetratricopeptide (TPR) repeat protein